MLNTAIFQANKYETIILTIKRLYFMKSLNQHLFDIVYNMNFLAYQMKFYFYDFKILYQIDQIDAQGKYFYKNVHTTFGPRFGALNKTLVIKYLYGYIAY